MKKYITRFAALVSVVTLFAFASCQKEEVGKTVFTATVENPDTQGKTAFNSGVMTWQNGDQIRVYEVTESSTASAVLQTSSNAATASFSFYDGTLPLEANNYYAIYPADIATGYNTILLGATQTYDGNRMTAPMYAYATGTELAFKNLCGVLVLNITANKSIQSIEIETPRHTVYGEFKLDYENASMTARASTGKNKVTLDCGAGVSCSTATNFYIYLPPGRYSQMTITINTTDDSRCIKTLNSAFTIERNKYYTLTLADEEWKPIHGSKGGLFSVSATKKVWFSQGNLQYQASTGTWQFAENQYAYVGTGNNNISATYSGWIDLFGWGTGNNPTNYSPDYTQYQTFTDWGVNAISNGGNIADGWRTLSLNEWYYLLLERSNTTNIGDNAHYAKGYVNNIFGLILFPDGYTHPTDVDLPTGINYSYTPSDWTYFNYSLSDWAKMEDAGAVFLPAAGFRVGVVTNDVGNNGYYWSSTSKDEYEAYCVMFLIFQGIYYNFGYHMYSEYGCSVRLVRDNN